MKSFNDTLLASQNTLIGNSPGGGKVGQTISVRVPGRAAIRARCVTDINPGKCVLMQSNRGWLVAGSTSRLLSERSTQNRIRKGVQTTAQDFVSTLFRVDKVNSTEIWLCEGDRKILLASYPVENITPYWYFYSLNYGDNLINTLQELNGSTTVSGPDTFYDPSGSYSFNVDSNSLNISNNLIFIEGIFRLRSFRYILGSIVASVTVAGSITENTNTVTGSISSQIREAFTDVGGLLIASAQGQGDTSPYTGNSSGTGEIELIDIFSGGTVNTEFINLTMSTNLVPTNPRSSSSNASVSLSITHRPRGWLSKVGRENFICVQYLSSTGRAMTDYFTVTSSNVIKSTSEFRVSPIEYSDLDFRSPIATYNMFLPSLVIDNLLKNDIISKQINRSKGLRYRFNLAESIQGQTLEQAIINTNESVRATVSYRDVVLNGEPIPEESGKTATVPGLNGASELLGIAYSS